IAGAELPLSFRCKGQLGEIFLATGHVAVDSQPFECEAPMRVGLEHIRERPGVAVLAVVIFRMRLDGEFVAPHAYLMFSKPFREQSIASIEVPFQPEAAGGNGGAAVEP